MKTTMLFLSDLHLRPRIKSGGVELEGDCLWAIEQIAGICKMIPDLTAIIVAGDIFDQKNVSPMELHLLKHLINVSGVPANRWYTIQGNHDRGGDVAIPQSLGCTSLHKTLHTIGGVRVWGCDYIQDREEYLNVIQNAPETDIMVLHYPCKPFNGISESAFSPADFRDNVLTVIGDTHVCTELHQGYKHLVSPGALFPQNKKELCSGNSCGGKLLVYDTDTCGKPVCEQLLIDIPLASRPGKDLSELDDITSDIETLLSTWDTKYANAVPNSAGKPKPVIYVNAEAISRPIDNRVIPIRVLGRLDTNTTTEPLKTDVSLFARIEQLVGAICKDDPLAAEYAAIINSMLATRDPKDTVRQVLIKKGVKFKNEATY